MQRRHGWSGAGIAAPRIAAMPPYTIMLGSEHAGCYEQFPPGFPGFCPRPCAPRMTYVHRNCFT
jgi:hypothetical protein